MDHRLLVMSLQFPASKKDLKFEIVRDCVEEVCPKVNTVKKAEPWEDEELKKQLDRLKQCTNTNQTRKLQKKNKIKYPKNKFYKQLADNITSIRQQRQGKWKNNSV